MKYQSKFDLDQRVFIIRCQNVTNEIECKICNNTGKVTIGIESFTCPKCLGRATHEEYFGVRWYVGDCGKIGKITVAQILPRYCYNPKIESGPKYNYMLDVTGVGSGTIHDESVLFASKDDAKQECIRRNKIILEQGYYNEAY